MLAWALNVGFAGGRTAGALIGELGASYTPVRTLNASNTQVKSLQGSTVSKQSPITRSLSWFVGEDATFEYTIFDSNASSANPVDITGYNWQWRLFSDDGTVLLTKTTASGISTTDANNGVLQVIILDTDTDAIANGVHRYELKRTDTGAEVVVAYGRAWLQRPGGP